jgi:hypothetical protein
MKMGLAFWENEGIAPPFFEACPYIWKCSIFHSSWRLEISLLSTKKILNLDSTWTFICVVGIFVSQKIEITKNSSRIACVMEIFCTLLQCKVHLSMFHSSPTSKIWYTSTKHDAHYNGAKPQNAIIQKFCTKGGQSLLSLLGTR